MVLSKEGLQEAMTLAHEIVRDLEQQGCEVSTVLLKTGRLAHLLGDAKTTTQLEKGATAAASAEAQLASAEQSRKFAETGKNPYSQPSMFGYAILQHRTELARWKQYAHSYATGVYNQLAFSNATVDVFDAIREDADGRIARLVPDAVKHLSSIKANLSSDNPEDWASAVHNCRRLLKRIADKVFPATSDPSHTDDKFINRLVTWVESRSKSETFATVVGSHLDYLGNRLDAIYKASTKGSHADVSRREATRYVVYTYMFVSDLVLLMEERDESEAV